MGGRGFSWQPTRCTTTDAESDLERGDVCSVMLAFPDRSGRPASQRLKHVVILQGGPTFASATDVAVVVCSTFRGQRVRAFEVLVGSQEGFDHDTVIDCRWPRTISKDLPGMASPITHLTPDAMTQISEALVVGLQM